MAIFLSLFNDIEYLHRVVDVSLCDALHVHDLVLGVLMNCQLSLFLAFF